LPGATGPAFLDLIAYDPANSRVWVPVGLTGTVDVFDTRSRTFSRVEGFKTEVRESNGKKRTLGPSAATVGDGVVYVGNRATNEVCPVDAKSLQVGKCLQLSSGIDVVGYVAPVREVWVTEPKENAMVVLDASSASALSVKTTIRTEGAPECYEVDEARGLFFTNLEDKGSTLAFDVKTHAKTASWDPGCGSEGPRGLAFDKVHDFLIVGCTDHVQVLDAGHDGLRLGRLDVGAGIDDIDWSDSKVYAAAGKAARLVVASLDARGQLAVVAVGDTSEGARNAVADGRGGAYVADSPGARLLAFSVASRGHDDAPR
jgi:DNA-binding beta-propeller fold protein YncE